MPHHGLFLNQMKAVSSQLGKATHFPGPSGKIYNHWSMGCQVGHQRGGEKEGKTKPNQTKPNQIQCVPRETASREVVRKGTTVHGMPAMYQALCTPDLKRIYRSVSLLELGPLYILGSFEIHIK